MLRACQPEPALAAPPGSFAALMELYESNYIFIRRLAPGLNVGVAREVSCGRHGVALYLSVHERARYTSTVRLTHRFAVPPRGEDLPDVDVRVYHDARVAEVVRARRQVPRGEGLAERWRLNRFLNRWLRFCLGEGHEFPAERGARGGR